MVRRDDVHQDTTPEPDEPLRYRCTACGAVYERIGDDPCPVCGEQRRRYIGDDFEPSRYGIPQEAIDVLDEVLWRDPVPARRAVVIQDLQGDFPPEWAIAPNVEQPFEPASDLSRAADEECVTTVPALDSERSEEGM
jgi:rubredoxin